MTETGAIMEQYIQRIERLEDERRELGQDIRDVYDDAKRNGFNPKILRRIVRERALGQESVGGGGVPVAPLSSGVGGY